MLPLTRRVAVHISGGTRLQETLGVCSVYSLEIPLGYFIRDQVEERDGKMAWRVRYNGKTEGCSWWYCEPASHVGWKFARGFECIYSNLDTRIYSARSLSGTTRLIRFLFGDLPFSVICKQPRNLSASSCTMNC